MKYKLNFLEFPYWIILLLSMFYDIWIFSGALDFHICKILKLPNCMDKLGEGNGNPLQYSCLENPRTEEPGGLLSMGSHRVGHDWSDLAAAAGINWYFSLYIQNTWLDHFILNLSHHTFHHHQYCWKTKMEIE